MNELVPVMSNGLVVPVVLADAGPDAVKAFINFFAGSIHNPSTRKAYLRSVKHFFAWLAEKGRPLAGVEPAHVGAYLHELGQKVSVPTVKQSLAAIRTLFDYLVVNQVLRTNPATSVRGPRHVVEMGKTPILDADDARKLLEAIDTSHVVGLRDRALIGVMIYSFARVGAAVALNADDYQLHGKRWHLVLHEKRGRVNRMPVHHKLADYLDSYLEAATIPAGKNEPIFRRTQGRSRKLLEKRMTTKDAWEMVQRRAKDAGIETKIGNHSFRATGITAYLSNGGTLEKAQQMAGHASAKTTKLYDRRQDLVTLDEVERILI